jgi:hypothetical protein
VSPRLPSPPVSGAVIGLVSAMAVLAQIIIRDEAASERTQLVVLFAAIAGFAAGMLVSTFGLLVAARWPVWLRAVVAALGIAGLVPLAAMLVFSVHNRIIEGHFEGDLFGGDGLLDLFWSLFGGMGMATPTGQRYLLPWPIVVIGLAALILYAGFPRSRSKESRP